MESRHNGDALVINPMAAGTDNTRIMPQKETERHFSESDDNFRLQEAYFFRRLLLVLFVSVLGIALMTGIYFIRLEPEVRFAVVGAVQFFMTVCNSVILGSSFFQRYRVYPRGSALAAVLILMYGVSDFFMPREVKYAVLAASVIGGFLLPETWGNKQV